MTDLNPISFVEVQEPVLERVERELKSGKERTHWMWLIFPQFAGLGHSTISQHFVIRSRDQARRYRSHSILGKRLRLHVQLILKSRGKTAHRILGTRDDLKLWSCMTLFAAVAESENDRSSSKEVLDHFYGAQPT